LITSTIAFGEFVQSFFIGGASLLTLSGRWHGGILLALLVGGLVLDVFFRFVDFAKERG